MSRPEKRPGRASSDLPVAVGPSIGRRAGRGSVPATVLKAVIARDGGECRYSKCTQGRLVTETPDDGWVFIGQIAHIRAARPGGQRFDPSMTKAIVNASTNLLVLCPLHHGEIDSHNTGRSSVERLDSWLDSARVAVPARKLRFLRVG